MTQTIELCRMLLENGADLVVDHANEIKEAINDWCK